MMQKTAEQHYVEGKTLSMTHKKNIISLFMMIIIISKYSNEFMNEKSHCIPFLQTKTM